MKIRNIILVTVSICCAISVNAQKRKPVVTVPKIEDLPRRPMDTIATTDPETKVIIFSNNTWEFFRPEISERMADNVAYKYNWDTVAIFAYRNIELADMPQVVELKLVDSLRQFATPMRGNIISKYGPRRRSNHNGVDIPLKTGEPLFAIFEGKVRYAKFNAGGYGNLVIIRHPNGLESWYAHLTRLNVKPNDFVKTGQVIGYGGSTGRSTGPHLHFELRYQDQSFDPEFIVDFANGQLRYQNFSLEKRFFNIRSRASEILEEDDVTLDAHAAGSLLAEANDSTIKTVQAPPKPKPVAAQPVYYKIRSGDTLGRIALKYRVSIDQICRLNKITRTTTLSINKTLRIK